MTMSLKNLRRFCLKLHLILALTFGFLFVILGLTGASNVFYYELREWGLPKPVKENTQSALPLDAILQGIKAQHPQRNGGWSLLLPGYGAAYLLVEYPNPEETQGKLFAPLEIMVDPYTGKIADQRFWGQSIPSILYELHAALMLGELGKTSGEIGFQIVCWGGLVLFISCLSGLYLWWPTGNFRKAITIKRHAGTERRTYDLHKLTGIFSISVMLILAFTGFSFAHKDYFQSLVTVFSSIDKNHLDPRQFNSIPQTGHTALKIAQVLRIADQIFPDAELRMVDTPDGFDGVYMVAKRQAGEANRKRPRSKVWIDQYSGAVLAVQDPNRFTAGETFMNLLWPLHDGQILGFPGRILWFLVGFAPLVLYVTGILRWLQKRRATKLRQAKLSPVYESR